MDSGSGNSSSMMIGFFMAFLLVGVYGIFLYLTTTRSKYPAIQGFYGGAPVGAGVPNCTRTSSEAAFLADLFAGKTSSTEEGEPDGREFTLLLSKLSCFKKDLMSPSGIVEATRYQEYRSSHDIEPVGETTARCFAKTIPPRDLEVSLEKWKTRGAFLLRRLCVSYDLTSAEIDKAEKAFQALLADVSDVARSSCLVGPVEIAGRPGPRDAHPNVPEEVTELGPYTGYY